jgi:ribosomal protein S18 acetylase RimI-like enzyme
MLAAVFVAGVCAIRLTIRELRREDIPRAASLLSDAFAPPGGYNVLQQRIIQAENEAGLSARLGSSLALLAEQEEDNALVGSVEVLTPAFLEGKSLRFWNSSLPLESYVSALAVAPGSRRSGVASALMDEVERRAWDANESFVSLQVDVQNTAAVNLYRRLGYLVVGRDYAVTTLSRNALVTSLFLGGAKERSLYVLQKARPEPEPSSSSTAAAAAAGGQPGRIVRWFRRALARLKLSSAA